MIHSKKLTLGICLVLLIILIGGCIIMTKINSRSAQIKDTFNQTLKLYPTKNLDDFYDKEGFRDQEFGKGDKGTWIISSEMNIQLKGGALKSREMVLYINRNTRTTKGYFLVGEITKDKKGYVHDKDGDISYNPNVPSYSAKYQLSNDDYNVQQLRKRYDIPTKQVPELLLKGDGDLKGSSIGSKDLEFNFVRNKEENIYFTDSVEFTPSEDTSYESN